MTKLTLVALALAASPALADKAPTAADVTARLVPLHRVYAAGSHAYALLGGTAPAGIKLGPLPGQSGYDSTEVADASTLATPHAFTVVTEQGACTVTSTHEVWLKLPTSSTAQRAIDLDVSSCGTDPATFAIDGKADVRADLPRQSSNAPDVATWIEHATGETPGTTYDGSVAAWSAWLPLTATTVVETSTDGKAAIRLLRRRDDSAVTLGRAYVLAELRWAGRDFIVVSDDKNLRAITP